MFEQSLLPKGRKNRWTVLVSVAFQCLMLATLIVIPLLFVEALPHARILHYIEPPPGPPAPPKPVEVLTRADSGHHSELAGDHLLAPTAIPDKISTVQDAEPLAPSFEVRSSGVSGGTGDPLSSFIPRVTAPPPPPEPQPEKKQSAPIRVGHLESSMALSRPSPAYPPLARQARIQGRVQLEAVISTGGTIESLRVVSGHPMLVPAALDAVRRWRYRPTLLNGEPVEVSTTIEVVFTLNP